MRLHELVMVFVVLSAAIPPMASAATPVDQRLAIQETDDSFRLSVPVSRLVMIIPRGDLKVVHDSGSGPTAGPRYFHFEDAPHGIIISGWFEPADSYGGIKKFWKGETDSWKKNGSNTHIRSEWVDLGTWIDVHISVTTAEPIDTARAKAMSVLKSIRITEAS